MSDVRKYREAVGSLIHLTTWRRPNRNFVLSKLSQYFTEPTEEQWTTVKHVLRYMKGTTDKELHYRKCDHEKLGLHAYTDADWAADVTDRCSATTYCVSQKWEWTFKFMENQKAAHCCTVHLWGRVYDVSHNHTRVYVPSSTTRGRWRTSVCTT